MRSGSSVRGGDSTGILPSRPMGKDRGCFSALCPANCRSLRCSAYATVNFLSLLALLQYSQKLSIRVISPDSLDAYLMHRRGFW